MNDSASVSASSSSLAISEKKPRRTGGCVGIFFQLFDWNRRFAKKKLFSKRLLPPDRAKEASKKFGGDEMLPKLRLIADENSGGFPNTNKNGAVNTSAGKNGVQTPSLVARLMGLESMPSVQRAKLLKDGEFRGGRREKVVGDSDDFEKETTRQECRPQKLQKTGMADRRSVTRFGAEALQLKNVLSRSRKHHHPKLASPVKNTSHHPKRNTSRLIGAATRILEPGLQARNKSKYTITYPHSARKPLGNELRSEPMENDLSSGHAACKNCGNLLDISESTSKRDVHTSISNSFNPSHAKTNCEPFNRAAVATNANSDTKDFIAMNRSLSGRTRSRVPSKFEDLKFDKRNTFENGRDNCLSQGQKRNLTHIRKQGEVCSSSNRPRMVRSAGGSGKQMESGSSSVDRSCNQKSDGMAFRFNSQMKNRCEVPRKVERRNQNSSVCKTTSRKKFTSDQSDEKICLQKLFPLTGDSLGALLEEKLHELRSRAEYESGINGTPPKRTRANIFQDLICALSMERSLAQNNMEFSPQRNHLSEHRSCGYDHNTSFCLQKKSEGLIGHINSDHLSPGSVLEASFSNDSCCSSSLDDSSVRTQHADSMSYSYEESQFQDPETDNFYYDAFSSKEDTHYSLIANLLTYISQVLCSIDVVKSRIKGSICSHVKEVIFNSELVLGSQTPYNPNEVNSFFICDLLLKLDTFEQVIWTIFGNFLGSHNSNARNQLKRFVFDALIEYLELTYVQYSKCGFRAWTKLPPFMGFDIIIHEVVEEVRRWIGFVGVDSDELVERDMNHYLGRWTDFEVETYETGAIISGDILQMLVDEIVIDIAYGLVHFRV